MTDPSLLEKRWRAEEVVSLYNATTPTQRQRDRLDLELDEILGVGTYELKLAGGWGRYKIEFK